MASIKKISFELNWELDKRVAYGNFKGFNVTLEQSISFGNAHNNFKVLYIPYERITVGSIKLLEGFIQANKKALRFIVVDVKEDIIIARLNETFKGANAKTIMESLEILDEGLRQVSAVPKKTCAYCNLDATDSVTFINKIKLPSHHSCKQEAIAANTAQRNQYDNQPNSPMGYVGALIGALVGVVPYAVAVWFGWFIGLLTILAGIASYQGFKLLGGHANKSTKYIISVFSFIAILLSNIGLMSVIAIANNVTISDVFSHPALNAAFMESFGMSALFGLIGVGYVFSRIRRDEHLTIIE